MQLQASVYISSVTQQAMTQAEISAHNPEIIIETDDVAPQLNEQNINTMHSESLA